MMKDHKEVLETNGRVRKTVLIQNTLELNLMKCTHGRLLKETLSDSQSVARRYGYMFLKSKSLSQPKATQNLHMWCVPHFLFFEDNLSLRCRQFL